MKTALLLLFLIPIVFAAGEEISMISAAEPAMSVSPDYYNNYECNLSDAELNNIKEFAITNFNLTDASMVNISHSSCYNYGEYYSIYVNMIAKSSESEISIKSISFSLSYSNEIDYDLLMQGKADYFDYNLRNNYYDYYINGTDEEYYVMISYSYDENYTLEEFKEGLAEYYESVSSEKYFQSDYDYPIMVFKSKTSELINMLPSFPAYISYYGDELTFTFQGYGEGDYDLARIALSNDCTIQISDYYYPEFSDECYGAYVDTERVYFSAYDYGEDYSISLSLYGVKGYKAELTASYYGEVSIAAVQDFIDSALSQYFPKYSFVPEFSDNYDSIIIRDFDFDESRFSTLNKTKDRQNTNYYNDKIYVSVIEPHISLYSSSERISSLDSKIMPPFYGQSTVITKDRVYSSIQIKENNAELAKTGLNEMLDGIVTVNDWSLNMSLRQYYYYYRGVYDLEASSIGKEETIGAGQDSSSPNFPTSSGIAGTEQSGSASGAAGQLSPSSPNLAGLSESREVIFDESKFASLDKEDSILDLILNFFASFFI